MGQVIWDVDVMSLNLVFITILSWLTIVLILPWWLLTTSTHTLLRIFCIFWTVCISSLSFNAMLRQTLRRRCHTWNSQVPNLWLWRRTIFEAFRQMHAPQPCMSVWNHGPWVHASKTKQSLAKSNMKDSETKFRVVGHSQLRIGFASPTFTVRFICWTLGCPKTGPKRLAPLPLGWWREESGMKKHILCSFFRLVGKLITCATTKQPFDYEIPVFWS